MRVFLVVLAAACALGGCSTPYQEMGALGGVRAVRITEDTVQITASGNAYTDPDVIQQYALRRSAEETVADGYDLFRIDTGADRTRVGSFSSASAYGGYRSAFGFGYTMPVVKPGETLLIKMLKGPRPDPMPDGEYDAREVLKYLAAATASADHKNCVPTVSGNVECH